MARMNAQAAENRGKNSIYCNRIFITMRYHAESESGGTNFQNWSGLKLIFLRHLGIYNYKEYKVKLCRLALLEN